KKNIRVVRVEFVDDPWKKVADGGRSRCDAGAPVLFRARLGQRDRLRDLAQGEDAMNDLLRIPCVLMRGGTSKGPYFLAADLPSDPRQRDQVLLAAMGSGHWLEIDGGNPLTSKVAIISPSEQPGADVDYLFAQVKVEERVVDTSPNCGNMLAGI